jgi:hypothetical protein
MEPQLTSEEEMRQELERTFQANLQLGRERRRERFGDRALAWLALGMAWTEELARATGFPADDVQGGNATADQTALRDFLLQAEEVGLCERQESREPGGKTVVHFWMPETVRAEVLEHLRKRPGEDFLKDQAARIGTNIMKADGTGLAISPVVAHWAELAVQTGRVGLAGAGRWLNIRVRELLDSEDTGGAIAWLRAGTVLAEALPGESRELPEAVQKADHRIELAYRRAQDRRHLADFYRRQEQIEPFLRLLREPPEGAWALHYVGSGGVGKTTLLRYITVELAPYLRASTSRVDFDHLSPNYPALRPGQLLLDLADKLRWPGPAGDIDDKLDDLRDRVRELHNALDAEPPPSDPLASLNQEEFKSALRTFIDLLRALPQPVVLILDTCEELTKLQPVGSRLPNVEATFDILKQVHGMLNTVKVIFAGRRLLARSGSDWHVIQAQQREGLAVLPEEKKYLRLHVLRGFDRGEALAYLSDRKKLSLAERTRDAILGRSQEAATVWPVEWDSSPPGEQEKRPSPVDPEEKRYNPFDLALYADWVQAEPELAPELITSGETDAYVESRIVKRLEPHLLKVLPAVVLLRRFDKEMLRPIVGEAALDDVYRALGNQEWMDYRTGETVETSFLEVHPRLHPRLLRYLQNTMPPAERQRVLSALVPELARRARQPLGKLGPIHLDAALRLLPPGEGAKLWDEVTLRIPNEVGWNWALTVTGRLLGAVGPEHAPGADRATIGPGHELRAGVRAVHVSAILHEHPAADVRTDWDEVAQTAPSYPDRDTARWLILRARAGRIAAHRPVGQLPAAEDLGALPQLLKEFAEWAKAADPVRAEQGAVSLLAAAEALLELGESVGDPQSRPAVAEAVAGLLRGATSPINLPTWELGAFAAVLAERNTLLFDRPLSSMPARVARALRPASSRKGERPNPGRWLDWREPDSLLDRVRLETILLFRAEIVRSYQNLLEGCEAEARTRMDKVDAERLLSLILRVRLAQEVPQGLELKELAELEAAHPHRHPACRSHEQVPPLFLTLAEGWSALGLGGRAIDLLNACVEQPRRTERDRRTAERGKLHAARWQRLYQRGRGALDRMSASQDTEEVRAAWAVQALTSRPAAGDSTVFDPGPSPPRLHAWWQSRTTQTTEAAQHTLLRLQDLVSAALGQAGQQRDAYHAASLTLDMQEAALLSRRTGVQAEFWAFPAPGERWVPSHPSQWEGGIRVRLREQAVQWRTPKETLPEESIRRHACLAVEEAELLALRLPGQALPLFSLAMSQFTEILDLAGACIAAIGGAVAAIRADDRRAAYETWRRALPVAYRALQRDAELGDGLPDWSQLEAWAEKPEPELLAGLAHTHWDGWLHRLFRCLVWYLEPGGTGERTAAANAWLTELYGSPLPVELDLQPTPWANFGEVRLEVWTPKGTTAAEVHPSTEVPVWMRLQAGGRNVEGSSKTPGLRPYREASAEMPAAVRDELRLLRILLGPKFAVALSVEPPLAASPWEALVVLPADEGEKRPRGALSGLDFRTIHEAVLSAFTLDDLRQLVRFELNENLDNIARPDSLSQVVFQVIQWTEARDRTEEFIRAVARERPSRQDIQALTKSLVGSEGILVPCWRSGPPLPEPPFTRSWEKGALAVVGSEASRELAERGWRPAGAEPRIVGDLAELAREGTTRVLHLIGKPTHTSGGVRLRVPGWRAPVARPGSAARGGDAEDLVLGADRVRLGGVPLVVVQAEPAESLDHAHSDREQAALLRGYAAQLFAAGAQVVLVLPQLTPELAEEALNRLAESLRGPEPSAGDEPSTPAKPDLLRLLEAVSAIQQAIREGKTVAARGTDVLEESRRELALEVCLFVHPAAPSSYRAGTVTGLSKFWASLTGQPVKEADQLVARIPPERADLPYTDQPLEPERGYFRLWLCGMSLARDRRWFRQWLPAVYAAVKLRFGDRDGATFSRFYQPPPQDGLDRGAWGHLNTPLTELIPYRGGGIEIQLALLALLGSDAVKVAADLLQDVCRLITPPLERVLPLAELVVNHTQKLLTATSARVHLGLNLELQPGIGPGYYAAVNAPQGQVAADGLFVRNDALLYASGSGRTPVPLTDQENLLFRLEIREGRDDWALLDIDTPLMRATEALIKGDLDAYKQYGRQAVLAALRLPDLTAADRRRVAQALQRELKEKEVVLSAGGLEFTANLTLNSIMARAGRS